jgi:hypothetical protein
MTKLPGTLATTLSLPSMLVTNIQRTNIWRSLKNGTMAGLILLIAFMGTTVRAQLVTNVTIYQDNFARTGALDGSMPDTVDATGASWIACNNPALNAQIQTDGSEIALTNVPGTTNGFYLNGFLPFTPQVGHIYTLTCKIAALSGGTNLLAMGFAVNPLTNNSYITVGCGAGLMLVRGDGSGIQSYRFPGGSGSPATKTAALGNTTNLFKVVLDTTTGTGAARGWTYRFFTNSVQVDSYSTANVNPYMIKYVGIGADAAQGIFQQFTLTDVLMRQGTPTIVEEPQNRTAPVGQTATFWVGVTNDYPSAAYQWMTNDGVGGPTNAIPGATNATYTTPVLDASFNGLNYSVSITNALGATNSGPAVLTVVSTPPVVYSATKTVAPTNIVVTFSKAVDPTTALNPANYALLVNTAPSGVSVIGATAGTVPGSVILQTTLMDTNQSYYLTVQNVQDLYGNAMTINTNALLPAGLVLFLRGDSGVVLDANNNVVQWLDQTTNGNNAAQFFGVPSVGLLGSAARPGMNTINNGQPSLDFGNLGSGVTLLHFLQAPPSASLATMVSNTTMYAVADFYSTAGNDLLNKTWGNLPAPFDWDPSAGENVQYGNGFNNAPASGAGATISVNVPYVLASKIQLPTTPGSGLTNFNFYLNGANNGAGSIRGVTGNPSGIYDGGTPLWIGGRSDLQAANPKMRGQIAEILLFNNALSDNDRIIVDNYLGAKYFQFAIIQDLPPTTTSSNGFSVTYTFVAGQGSGHGFSYQWQENGTNVPGATGQTFTTGILGPGDNGDTFDVVLTLPDGSITNSVTNTLTVLSEPPFVASAGFPIWEATSPSHIVLTFDEAVDPATATVAGNYTLNSGSVVSAAIGSKPNKVVLTTTPLTAWNANPGTYLVTVQNVQDFFGNTIVTAQVPVGLYPAGTSLWLEGNTGVGIDAGGNPVFPGSSAVNQWNDQSGNGANLYQVFNTSLEPLLVTNYHGNPAIQFSGTNVGVNYNGKASGTFLSSVQLVGGNDYPCLRITGDLSIIAVATFNASVGTSGEIVGKTGSTSANQPAPYDYFSGTGVQLLRGDGTNNTSFTSTNAPSIGVPHIVGVTQAGFGVTHFLDGAITGIGSMNALSPYVDQGSPLSIGERNDTVNRLNGQMLELILISSALDSNDVVSLNNYLATKYTIPTGANSYPAITQQPVSVTNISQNATLTVPAGVSGNPLAIQWYDTNSVAISGQTNATLSIPNVQTSDAYYLVATNIYGSVTSSKVVVNVAGINSNPTNITFSVANNQLTLTWPADHIGWELQSNSVGLTAPDSWFTIPGSTATNQFIVTPDLSGSNVFYRMVYP